MASAHWKLFLRLKSGFDAFMHLMKTRSLMLLALAVLLTSAAANDQMREWTLASGEKRQAEIVSFDENSMRVTLRLPDETEVVMKEAELSAIDRAWILEWVERDEEARALLARTGGTLTEHVATGRFTTEYAVFRPAGAAADERLPMLILFHPGGNGRRTIYRYVESAAAVGLALVSVDHFRNTADDPVREAEMLERFKELLPHIETTVIHDPERVFMGGASGGAWRAYHYSAQVPRPWAGILACGGWLGGRKYADLPYPPLRVAMVNGDRDQGANGWIDRDAEVLRRRGGTVSVHAFEGGHQIAPPSVQEKAL